MATATSGTQGFEPLRFRTPRAEELPALTELCMRSKAVWGYDEAFMAACRAELTIDPAEIETSAFAVAERDGKVVGLVQVTHEDDVAEVARIFVAPLALRLGIGRQLFAWAVAAARAGGAKRMVVSADPFAAPFYRAMGMVDIGTAPSGSIPGRLLPRLDMTLIGSKSAGAR